LQPHSVNMPAVADSKDLANSRNIRVVIGSGPLAPLSENLTSSTKPVVHNILHCRHTRTKPPPCTENGKIWTSGFYPRDNASAVLAVIVCLSVCPSVRQSQVGVLLKQLNRVSNKQRHTISQRL